MSNQTPNSLEEKCWDGYTQKGMKKKGDKMVPNCVPVKEKEDPDIGDRKGSQPAKYHSGLSKSTKAKRDAHFKKGQKMDDDNPAAYKPAPGDASSKTKESKYTKKYKKMYGEEMSTEEIFEDVTAALKKKSEKSGVSMGVLRKVYNRGVAAWRTGHRPGTTPAQWGMARVNSYITKGKTYHTADKDLREAVDSADTGGAEETSMAVKQIAAMRHFLDGIEARVKKEGDMEEWYQNKLTKANDYLKTLYSYGKGDVAESMDPRDYTDKAGYLVVVKSKKGKEEIKNFFNTKPAAQKYADRVNKVNRVGDKATVVKTDGRKMMKESKMVHVRLDHLDGDSRMDKAVDVLKKYEKNKSISFDGETDKGVLFKVLKPAMISGLNRELKKMATSAISEEVKTIKVGEDAVGSNQCHYALVMDRKVTAVGTKEEMLARCEEEGGRVWVSTKQVGDIVEATFRVDVEGLPTFYMNAPSQAKVKLALRKLLRKASSIDDVERVTPTKVRADYRDRVKNPTPDSEEGDTE